MTSTTQHDVIDTVTTATSGGLSLNTAQTITTDIIWLMGMSFILGVFFTTFLLLLLEFVRRNRGQEEE